MDSGATGDMVLLDTVVVDEKSVCPGFLKWNFDGVFQGFNHYRMVIHSHNANIEWQGMNFEPVPPDCLKWQSSGVTITDAINATYFHLFPASLLFPSVEYVYSVVDLYTDTMTFQWQTFKDEALTEVIMDGNGYIDHTPTMPVTGFSYGSQMADCSDIFVTISIYGSN